MITTTPPEWMKDNSKKYCKNCARLTFRLPVYIKRGEYVDELCYCDDCWKEILEKINWPEYRKQ